MTLKTNPDADKPPVNDKPSDAHAADKATEKAADKVERKAGDRSDAEQAAVKQRETAEAKLAEIQTRQQRTPLNTVPAGPLRPAGESSDPNVHLLLAQRQAILENADLNEDPDHLAALDAAKDVARARVAEVDARLESYGYTAK